MATKKKTNYDQLLSKSGAAQPPVSGNPRRTGIGAQEATPVTRRPQSAVPLAGRTRAVTFKLPEDVIALIDQVVKEAAADGYRVYKQDVVAEAVRSYWRAGDTETQ